MTEELVELQTQLAFQDHTIATLNEALASQQKQLDVLRLELEYNFLKIALEKENNMFESIRRQHERKCASIVDQLTKKFFELTTAKINAKRYFKERGGENHE